MQSRPLYVPIYIEFQGRPSNIVQNTVKVINAAMQCRNVNINNENFANIFVAKMFSKFTYTNFANFRDNFTGNTKSFLQRISWAVPLENLFVNFLKIKEN